MDLPLIMSLLAWKAISFEQLWLRVANCFNKGKESTA